MDCDHAQSATQGYISGLKVWSMIINSLLAEKLVTATISWKTTGNSVVPSHEKIWVTPTKSWKNMGNSYHVMKKYG